LGWLIYSDGVKLGGIYGSKEAAFEAATVAAMFAVRDGAGVQINVPRAGEERNTEYPLTFPTWQHLKAIVGMTPGSRR
jgi:hypothetical protein